MTKGIKIHVKTGKVARNTNTKAKRPASSNAAKPVRSGVSKSTGGTYVVPPKVVIKPRKAIRRSRADDLRIARERSVAHSVRTVPQTKPPLVISGARVLALIFIVIGAAAIGLAAGWGFAAFFLVGFFFGVGHASI
jgi:hypothetical protein